MLTRRLFLTAPTILVGVATVSTTPAMSREDAFALVKERSEAALAPYSPPYPKWGEAPDVVHEWLHFYKKETDIFKTPDDFVWHRVKTFFYNGHVTYRAQQNKLVNERGRLEHKAQLLLPKIFPLELDQFDQAFVSALLMLDPECRQF